MGFTKPQPQTTLGLVILAFLTLFATTAVAGQPAAPQPPGIPAESWWSFRNGNRQLGVADAPLPDKLEVLWTYPTEYGVAGTAAIVEDRVFVPTLDGELLCLDRQTGKLVWKYRSIADPDPEAFAPGFKASPTVTADAVYLGDEDGVFHCIDRKTGKQRWTFASNDEIVSSASIVGDRVIFASYDSYLYCLSAEDGKEIWSFATNDRINGSPATDGRHAFVTGCDQHLRAIDVQTGKQVTDMPLETILIATPALREDRLYFGTSSSEVLCVDWQNQKIVWRYKSPHGEFRYHSSAAVTDRFVIAGSMDKHVHCIDRQTGQGVWTFPTRAAVDSSPVVVGDRVFVGSSDGHLYGLSLTDGKELWSHKLGRNVTASPAVGHGVLVIGAADDEGTIYCFGQK